MTTGIDLASSDLARTPGDAAAVPDVVAAIQGFAGRLFRQASAQGNAIMSPFSVAMALAMTVNGAVGDTRAEMLDVLGIADLDTFNAGLNALTQGLESLAGPVTRSDGSKAAIALDAANSLWGQRDTAWQRPFLDELARDYGTGLRLVDYQTAAEQARTAINDWVAAQTHGKITDLVPPGVLDALTRLVLVNAIHLKAPWEKPFTESLTATMPFDGGRLHVPTMVEREMPATLRRGSGWRAATLAYAGGSLAMTLVLPDPGRLADIEASWAREGLAPFVEGGEATAVDLALPRWTTRTALGLKGPLTRLGMPTAFDSAAADFSGMTTQERLFVSAVLHQGFIAVDEAGTEAAAATAVVMSTTSARLTEPFAVDRPFLFVVHDAAHGTPLFLGRVVDPTA